jgi:hypothetical protein
MSAAASSSSVAATVFGEDSSKKTGDSDDGFPYPFPITPGAVVSSTSSTPIIGLTFFNALEAVAFLYKSAGLLTSNTPAVKSSSSSSSSSAPAAAVIIDDNIKKEWFKYKTQVLPGGIVMRLVESIVVPTPKGPQFTTSKRVLSVYDRRYLLEFEPSSVLSQYSYTELDELRFAYLAVADLLVDGKVFAGQWELTGLAKRDIKKNNTQEVMLQAITTGGIAGGVGASVANVKGQAGGGTGSSGKIRVAADRPKADATQKHMKAILEDECVARWPHTPAKKSASVELEQDPNQPRHKPLYKGIVTLMYCGNTKIEGPWMGNKKRKYEERGASGWGIKRMQRMQQPSWLSVG